MGHEPDNADVVNRISSIGRPVVHLRIADASNMTEPVPAGVAGSIQILPHPTRTFLGYFKNPEKTWDKFTADGWIISGDMGWLDNEGYLYIDGRDSERFVLPGVVVYAGDMENVISELKAVRDVGICKIEVGRLPKISVFIQVHPGSELSVEDVKNHCCKTELFKPAIPHVVVFIQEESLPYSNNGKLLRRSLVDYAEARLKEVTPICAATVGGA